MSATKQNNSASSRPVKRHIWRPNESVNIHFQKSFSAKTEAYGKPVLRPPSTRGAGLRRTAAIWKRRSRETRPLAKPITHLSKLVRSSASPAYLVWLRAAIGAGLGVGLAAALSLLTITSGSIGTLPLLVAPLGASAVLVFAVPASPLAQPWSVVGGNLMSAAIGLIAGHLIGMPAVAASVAVSTAIAAMSLARCLHPPGGACALLYALGAAGPDHWGTPHLLVIAINVAGLSATGWLYNNATGHSWPHRPVYVPPVPPGTHSARIHDALVEVLAEWNEVIDADVDDLDAIFRTVEQRIRSAEQDAPPAALI